MTTIRDLILSDDSSNCEPSEHGSDCHASSDPFEREVAQRIKMVKKMTRMTAPEVFAEESFPDVNIVSEYIDRQLDEPQLARDYEDACLSDSMLLAELVDCAQWADSLTGPIELTVPDHCRHRLYYAQDNEECTLLPKALETGLDEHIAPPSTDPQNGLNQTSENTSSEDTAPVAGHVADDRALDEALVTDMEQNAESACLACAKDVQELDPKHVHAPKRFNGKKVIHDLYRASVMIALTGIVVLFLRLPPEARHENLSRLRNIWTIFRSDGTPSGKGTDATRLPRQADPASGVSEGETTGTQGDFPLPALPISSCDPSQELCPLIPESSVNSVERVSLQPSFVIPGEKDLLQSNPEILR